MRWPKEAWDKAAECSEALKIEVDPGNRARLMAERDGWVELAKLIITKEHEAMMQVLHARRTQRLH